MLSFNRERLVVTWMISLCLLISCAVFKIYFTAVTQDLVLLLHAFHLQPLIKGLSFVPPSPAWDECSDAPCLCAAQKSCPYWCSLSLGQHGWITNTLPGSIFSASSPRSALLFPWNLSCTLLWMQQGVRITPTVPFYSWPSASLTSQPKSVRLLKMACIFCVRESLSPTGLQYCWLSHFRAEQPGAELCPLPLSMTPLSSPAYVASGWAVLWQQVLWILQLLFLSFIACFMPEKLNFGELSLGIISVSIFISFNACDCWVRQHMLFVPLPNNLSVKSTRTDYSSAAGG